ncbi:MAG TPA: CHRD domain-containing protein [Caldimonas sp.]
MITTRTFLGGALLATTFAIAGCGMMSMSKTASATNQLAGAQEVPPKPGSGSGTVVTSLDKETRMLRWTVTYSGLSGPVTAGHFHGPAAAGANAGVVVPFTGSMASPIQGSATLTEAQMADLLAGKWYANLHTAANPGGEIRGQVTGL